MADVIDLDLGPVYTVAEVAPALRVSRETVRRWIAAGVLDGFKVGGVFRVRESALSAFKRANSADGESSTEPAVTAGAA